MIKKTQQYSHRETQRDTERQRQRHIHTITQGGRLVFSYTLWHINYYR